MLVGCSANLQSFLRLIYSDACLGLRGKHHSELAGVKFEGYQSGKTTSVFSRTFD